MLGIIIIIVIAIFLIVKYEHTVIFITTWSLALSVLNGIGVSVSVFQVVAIIAVLLFPFKIKIATIKNDKYPLWICMAAVGISLFVSNYYASERQWHTLIIHILSFYCFMFVFWLSLSTAKKIVFFLKNLIFFLIILTIYGLIEVFTTINPIITWIIDNDLANNDVGEMELFRFGFKRIQSFLAYSGALGICCGMSFTFLLFVNMYYKKYLEPYKSVLIFLFILLPVCVLLTGTRSVILASAVGLFAVLNSNIFKSKWLYIAIYLFLPVIPFTITYFSDIVNSFLDTSSAEGSNTDMREIQFGLSIAFWFQSFWVGNGINFTSNYVMEDFSDQILGAESIWMPLMMDRGLFGILSYIIVIAVPVYLLIRHNLKSGFFIVLAFLIAKSLSSIPGVPETYHFTYTIVLLKIHQLTNNENIIKIKTIQNQKALELA
jgi:hypothetical protein